MESTVLVKAFGLLEALTGQPAEQPLANLAARTGLPKPTVHRVLQNLVALGYVQRCGAGVYRLTDKLQRLALGGDGARLLGRAQPILDQLHQATGETVNLAELRDDRVVYLAVMESTHPLRRVVHAQEDDPFHCTALGRAMAAWLDQPQQESLLRRCRFEPRTERTIVDQDELRQRLRQARQDGYAIEEDETDLGVMCMAAPVFEHDHPVAAISLSVPTARADEPRRSQLVRQVSQAAHQLTSLLTASSFKKP